VSFGYCPLLDNAHIGLTLVEGTSYEQAKELATILNGKLKGVFLTQH